MDRASDYGSEGWGFESLRARSGPPRCDPPVGVLHFGKHSCGGAFPSPLRPFSFPNRVHRVAPPVRCAHVMPAHAACCRASRRDVAPPAYTHRTATHPARAPACAGHATPCLVPRRVGAAHVPCAAAPTPPTHCAARTPRRRASRRVGPAYTRCTCAGHVTPLPGGWHCDSRMWIGCAHVDRLCARG